MSLNFLYLKRGWSCLTYLPKGSYRFYYEGVRAVCWGEGTLPSGVGRAEQAAGAVGVSVWFSQAGCEVVEQE